MAVVSLEADAEGGVEAAGGIGGGAGGQRHGDGELEERVHAVRQSETDAGAGGGGDLKADIAAADDRQPAPGARPPLA